MYRNEPSFHPVLFQDRSWSETNGCKAKTGWCAMDGNGWYLGALCAHLASLKFSRRAVQRSCLGHFAGKVASWTPAVWKRGAGAIGALIRLIFAIRSPWWKKWQYIFLEGVISSRIFGFFGILQLFRLNDSGCSSAKKTSNNAICMRFRKWFDHFHAVSFFNDILYPVEGQLAQKKSYDVIVAMQHGRFVWSVRRTERSFLNS